MSQAGRSADIDPDAVTIAVADNQDGQRTVTSFPQEQGIDGRVDLSSGTGTSKTEAAQILAQAVTTEGHRRYEIGALVDKGGMGAILFAKDVNLRRPVAMKVMLEREGAGKEAVLRFVEEAQVTGQLEHPGVVPVHELGVGADGKVYYTMKFVRGRTLKNIVKGIAGGDTAVVKEFPLSRLLTVFQKVCDAIAFAHSKRVIHRDLKPDNIMVGEYGEVLVMDWGLAKILPEKGGTGPCLQTPMKTSPAGPVSAPAHRVESARQEPGVEMTMVGSVMGTPGYMAPEQAMGEVDQLDERADIYALGAILYFILTLRPSVEGIDVMDLLHKVTAGEITHPSAYNDKGRSVRTASHPPSHDTMAREAVTAGPASSVSQSRAALVHLPGQRVPDSLAAVAMKALSLRPEDRYLAVEDLQQEIEAYQNGFATRAEQAGVLRQLVLFVGRHKALAAAVCVIAGLIVAGSAVSTLLWLKAERHRARAESAQKAEAERRDEAVKNGYCYAIIGAQGRIAAEAYEEARALLVNTPPYLRGWEWGWLMPACEQHAVLFHDHAERILVADLSPAGDRYATGGSDHTARIWDSKTGRLIHTLKGHERNITSIAFSGDGKQLISGCNDNTAMLWDADTGRLLHTLAGHGHSTSKICEDGNYFDSGVTAVALSSDGKLAATGGYDNTVRLWDAATGKELATFPDDGRAAWYEIGGSTIRGGVCSLAFFPDGTRLIAGGWNCSVKIWDMTSHKLSITWDVSPVPLAMTVSSDNTTIAIVEAYKKQVSLWDAGTGKQIRTFGGTRHAVLAVDLSRDGKRIMVGSGDNNAMVWDCTTGELLFTGHGHAGPVSAVGFLQDGNRFFTASNDGTARFWDSRNTSGARLVQNTGTWSASYACFTPDGRALLSPAGARSIVLRDTADLRELCAFSVEHDVISAAFDQSASRLVLGGTEGRLTLWDMQKREAIATWAGHKGYVTQVAFSPDGRHILSSSMDKTACIWEAQNGKRIRSLEGHASGLVGAVYSPDGSQIMTAGDSDKTAIMWDAATGKKLRTIRGRKSTGGAYSPDGTLVLAVGTLWDLRNGSQRCEILGEGIGEDVVVFSPDGKRVLVGGSVYDCLTGNKLVMLAELSQTICAGAFSPDGRLLALGEMRGMVKLYPTLDWSKSVEDLNQEKLRRWQASWLH